MFWNLRNPGAGFSKVPIINGRGKLSPFTLGFNSFASNMIKQSVNETKWSSLLARTCTLFLYILIWISDFGPVKLPGLSRNRPFGPQHIVFSLPKGKSCYPVVLWTSTILNFIVRNPRVLVQKFCSKLETQKQTGHLRFLITLLAL